MIRLCSVLYAVEEGSAWTWHHMVYAVFNGGVQLRTLVLVPSASKGRYASQCNHLICGHLQQRIR